jgi:Na+:H+ antiporter
VPNTVFTTFAYVFILFGTAELLGYSGAIAALVFGVAVANFPNIPDNVFGRIFSFRLAAFAEHERAFFAEAVFLVKTFFFVFLGVSMTFGDWRAVAAGLALVIAAFLVRAVVVRLLGPTGMNRRDSMLMTALIPKGLAAAVLASLPLQAGLAGGASLQSAVYAAVFFSIVLCAALVFTVERGLLDPIAAVWLTKYPVEALPKDERPSTALLIEPILAPPDLIAAYQEPNPIMDLEPKVDTASDEERPPESGADSGEKSES